jgi:GrpB-like predicted nucleotidyltransferase (UPF0157 family)
MAQILMSIRILPPDLSWPQRFQALKSHLAPALPPGALVHHIGSTAVPGLAAKDIVDIQVTLPDLTATPHAALLALGLGRRPPTGDHCPPGMTLPPADLAKFLYRAATPWRANIHIRAAGRFNQRYPLLCRDWLRAHPLGRDAYQTIKQELALRFPMDEESYYAIKDPAFDLLMAGAEDWARLTGWQPPPGD